MRRITEENIRRGKYPTGKSSTEIFQKLIDEKYATDPNIFWFQLPGKVRPISNALKPENVCWDVTADVDANSPDDLPVVFTTGYRMTYEAGGRAVPLFPSGEERPGGIAVSYKDTASVFFKNVSGSSQIRNVVVSATFDSHGKGFRQLTPEGEPGP